MALDKSIKCLTNDNRKQHVFIGIRWQFQELLVKVRLRQPQSRGNKTSHSSQLKDAAGEDRGWLLATDLHNQTSWYSISRCSAGRSVIPCMACRSVIDPRKGRKLRECQQDSRGIKLTHPGATLRRNPSIYWTIEQLEFRARAKMRPREQGGASTERRTGADPEKSNPPTPPGEWLQEVVNNGDFAKEISKFRWLYPVADQQPDCCRIL
ncbi:hypothetical protein T4D_13234 [Trichinella pseudospiralis]|uniref:Uncharacterized protein n=1 Tax=Trichinella pseudospiralis TaxID=6337 RepID=A0A0V1G7I5_TRIPS|nr:hypothetical protein T4D_13234 [Trichinella pseudospiralis]